MLSKPGIFEAPSAASVPPLDDYIQPTLNHALRVWWAYYWPTMLAVIGISMLVGIFLGILIVTAGVQPSAARLIAVVQTYIWTLVISIFSIRYILSKRFQHFRIGLLPSTSSGSIEILPRTFQRTIRVWWAFVWRMEVGSVIVRLAAWVALGYGLAILMTMGRVMAVLTPIISQVVIDGAVGLFVMYSAILDEEFGDFRVALLPRKEVVPVAPVAAPAASDAP